MAYSSNNFVKIIFFWNIECCYVPEGPGHRQRDSRMDKCFTHCPARSNKKNKNDSYNDDENGTSIGKCRSISEYQDTVCRVGEVILKTKMHDHRRCNANKNPCGHKFVLYSDKDQSCTFNH